MRNLKIVFGYELRNQLRKKSMVVTTIGIMVLILILFSIPRISGLFTSSSQPDTPAATTNRLAENTGYVFANADMLSPLEKELGLTASNIYTSRDALVKDLQSKQLTVGFVINSETAFETLWQDKSMEATQGERLATTLKNMYINRQLAEKNITVSELEAIQNVHIQQAETVMGKDSNNSIFLAFALLVVVYMIVLIYGNITSTMVAREKDSKTMELLITSCKPSSLIIGKVAASGVSAILQMSCLALAAVVGYHLNKALLPPFMVAMLAGTLTQSYILTYLFYSVFGYIMYLFLYAALGSTVSRVEDVNNATGFVQFIFIAGYIASSFAMNMPNSALATVCSMIPFTSLMVMPLRSALITVPFWQHLVSGSLLLMTTLLLAFLSIKIYRWGTLNYGNKTGFFHAIKMALKRDNA